MNIVWNKVTWYSKLFAVILFGLTFYVGFKLGQDYADIKISTLQTETSVKQTASNNVSNVSITSQKITEDNFTGTMPVFSGSSTVAVAARAYVDQTISDFRKQANTDVPALRAQFGSDAPPAHYEIDIDAKYIKSAQTESIETSIYTFTGGAHGSTTYKVFTVSLSTSKILALSDVIKTGEQTAFTVFVKQELNNWKMADGTPMGVFPDSVNALTFASFTNWSLDNNNLNIYFDQYAIGPGVLGAEVFPISLDEINSYMNASF